MNKDKLLAALMVLAVGMNFVVSPALAIVETKSEKTTVECSGKNVLNTINFDKWKQKNDPFLEGYIIRAIDKNYDVKTAKLKLEETRLNVMAVRAGLLPTLEANFVPTVAKLPGLTSTQGSFAIPIVASWELDLFGKNWDKTKSAKKIVEATDYGSQSVDIAITSAVVSVYYNIVNLDKQIELQQKLASQRAEIYRLKKLSNQEGIVSTSDLILAEKAYILADNDLITYKKARQNMLNSLAVLLGDSPENVGEYSRISMNDMSDKFNVPEEISSEIIVNRPDYKSLEKQIEAAGLNIRAAKKEFLPTFNILGLVSFVATSATHSMNWTNAIAFASGGASLPIFTGFKRVANLKLNKNKYEQLLQAYEKTNLTAIQEVNDSLYNYKSDNEKLLNNIKAYEIQKKDFAFARSKFESGVISKLDLLQQEEALLYMQKLLSQAITDCYIDEVSLYKATGGKV